MQNLNWTETRARLIDHGVDAARLPEEWQPQINLVGADLTRAYLRDVNLACADLTRACLRDADLAGAELTRAYLVDADMAGTDLRDADLERADLTRADLVDADLAGTDLVDADLTDADVTGTILDEPDKPHGKILHSRHGGMVLYRTATSIHIGDTEYVPGRTYIAPVWSRCPMSDCHPGIYANTLEAMRQDYPDSDLVKIYVRFGEAHYVGPNKGWRCKRVRVLGAETHTA